MAKNLDNLRDAVTLLREAEKNIAVFCRNNRDESGVRLDGLDDALRDLDVIQQTCKAEIEVEEHERLKRWNTGTMIGEEPIVW